MSSFLKNNPLTLAGESGGGGAGSKRRKPAAAVVPGEVIRLPDATLPHQRDESADSTGAIQSEAMQQAYRDILRGLPDTDRAAEVGRTYRKLKR